MADAPSTPRRPGTVYTFYSYKGGVGRSMALANVGVLMAMEGQRVLLVDWDLEAPGLEVFFRNAARLTPDAAIRPGIVDLLESQARRERLPWRDCLLQAEFFGCSLDIITAGRRTGDYRQRVQQLNWEELFSRHQIGNYISGLRDEWREVYDVVLIDSRTGITDIGDICTVLLPDVLVLMFVANLQNVEGINDAMSRATSARAKLPVNRSKLLGVPVPSRDERDREYARSREWQDRFATAFGDLYREWLPKEVKPADALNKLYIPYVAAWSFGESIPVLESDRERSDPSSLGAAYTRLATLLLHRLDWYAIEGRAPVEELIGTRVELSKAREERALAEVRAAATARSARRWVLAILVLFVLAAVGGVLWYRNLPPPTSTDLLVGDELRRSGDFAGAVKVYEARRTFLEQTAARSPGDKEVLRELIVVSYRLADVLRQQGRLKDAVAALSKSKTIAERLAAEPGNVEARRGLADHYRWFGTLLEDQARLEEAVTSCGAGLSVLRDLAEADPQNEEIQLELAEMLLQLGAARRLQGRIAEAHRAFVEAAPMVDRLVKANPRSTSYLRAQLRVATLTGRVLQDQGNLAGAAAAYTTAQAVARKRRDAQPRDDNELQLDVTTTDLDVADIQIAQGRFEEALATLRKASEALATLVKTSPQDHRARRNLATSHYLIGRVRLAQGKPAEALDSFRTDTEATEKLAAAYPENTSYQRDLAASLKFLGRTWLELGRPEDALRSLNPAVALSGRADLAALARARRDLLGIQRHRVEAFLTLNDTAAARGACNAGRTGAPQRDENAVFWDAAVIELEMACAAVDFREGKGREAEVSRLDVLRRLDAFSASVGDVEARDELRRDMLRLQALRRRQGS